MYFYTEDTVVYRGDFPTPLLVVFHNRFEMATHKCKHILKRTIEDAEAVEVPLVLATSRDITEGST